ncbi:uncharacterized protein LOC110450312 [Mizuhopecten yessoensis]|uniref:uncharacterized protein LOC110450312 n=1 Tax=Mizuhopecten yessoensis TaxID=6573 RepID=UPI000B45C1AB|nr:uncharacterized protein LOC110450312 [Mizuhopecten yessoensis]
MGFDSTGKKKRNLMLTEEHGEDTTTIRNPRGTWLLTRKVIPSAVIWIESNMASAQVKPKSPYVYTYSTDSMKITDDRKKSGSVKIAEGSKKEDGSKSKSGQNKKACNVPDTNLLLACLVTVCFHPLFGAVAAYLSISAASAYRDGRRKEGEMRAFISVIVSLVGIVFTVVLVMTLVLWLTIGDYKLPVES